MGKNNRLRIGILFNVSRNWLGGVYYIINLVRSLDFLNDDDKPELIVFYSEELENFIEEMSYRHITFVPWEFESSVKGYLKSWATGKNAFSNKLVSEFDLAGIYPEWNQPLPVKKAYERKVKSVSWFADLQHKYYPEFFTRKQLLMREFRLRLVLRHTDDLVVSSIAARNDFRKFYRLRDDLNIHVLNFVSIIEDFEEGDDCNIYEKYSLPEQYYLVSNQFHNHKNHQIVLNALAEIKKQGSAVHLAITGKMPDQKDSPYIRTLYEIVKAHRLDEQVSFLGVIPRRDQLSLMKNSTAVIQPSLFEGWSTVIEDAKTLQVPVLASNLDVNIEQLGKSGIYFDPHNSKQLAELMISPEKRNRSNLYEDYQSRVKAFAEKFIEIFK